MSRLAQDDLIGEYSPAS